MHKKSLESTKALDTSHTHFEALHVGRKHRPTKTRIPNLPPFFVRPSHLDFVQLKLMATDFFAFVYQLHSFVRVYCPGSAFRWRFQNTFVKSFHEGLTVQFWAGPIFEDHLWKTEAATQHVASLVLKPSSHTLTYTTHNAAYASLETIWAQLKPCDCPVGHPLLSAYRTKSFACRCGSFLVPLERFSQTFRACALTGTPLMNEAGLEDSFHCFKHKIEPIVKAISRKLRSDHLRLLDAPV